MQPVFKITSFGLMESFNQFMALCSLQGRDMQQTMRRVMRYWISFALGDDKQSPTGGKKIPSGDKLKIMTRMRTIVSATKSPKRKAMRKAGVSAPSFNEPSPRGKRRKRVKTKASNEWRGTVAAMLIALLDYKGARKMSAAQFYKTAGLFASRRTYAANLHRAGLFPALQALKARSNLWGELPKFRSQPGNFREIYTERLSKIMVEDFASSSPTPLNPRPAGIIGLAGDAFEKALPELDLLVRQWFYADLIQNAKKSGLKAA